MGIDNRIAVSFTTLPQEFTGHLITQLVAAMESFGFVSGGRTFHEIRSDKALLIEFPFPEGIGVIHAPLERLWDFVTKYKRISLGFSRDFTGYGWDGDLELSPLVQTWWFSFYFKDPANVFDSVTLWTEAAAFYPPTDSAPDNFDNSLIRLVERAAEVLHGFFSSSRTYGYAEPKHGELEDPTVFLISAGETRWISDCDPEWIEPIKKL